MPFNTFLLLLTSLKNPNPTHKNSISSNVSAKIITIVSCFLNKHILRLKWLVRPICIQNGNGDIAS